MNKMNSKRINICCLAVLTMLLATAHIGAQCDQACFGSSNTAFGNGAGNAANSTGVGVTSVGFSAGASNTTGVLNSFFGSNAGLSNTTGSYNSFFGAEAGQHIIGGSRNICFGKGAGPTMDSSAVSDRLYIDVEERNDPLLYGEFENDLVRINGTFEVAGGLSNPSSNQLKEQFSPVDLTNVLGKINDLQIAEWSYKSDPEVRHAGSTAEDFHVAFGLGNNAQIISTIDADGVILAAIQALDKKVKEKEQLLKRVEVLIEKNKKLQARRLEIEKMMGGE